MKKDEEVKTLQNGGKQELRSCPGSIILRVASEAPWEVVLHDPVFFISSLFHHEPCCILPHPLQPSDLVCWQTCKNGAAIIKEGYDHCRSKSCSSTLRQVRSDWRDSSELSKGCVADAADVLQHWQCANCNVLSRWTPRWLTDVLKGTLFPPMFAHSLSTDSGWDSRWNSSQDSTHN